MNNIIAFNGTRYTNNGNPYEKTNTGKYVASGAGLVTVSYLHLKSKDSLKSNLEQKALKIQKASYFVYAAILAGIFISEFSVGALTDLLINHARRKVADKNMDIEV